MASKSGNVMTAKIAEAMKAVDELKSELRSTKNDPTKLAGLLQKMTKIYSDLTSHVGKGDVDMTDDQLEELQSAVTKLSSSVQEINGAQISNLMKAQKAEESTSDSVEELASVVHDFIKGTDSRLKKIEGAIVDIKKKI